MSDTDPPPDPEHPLLVLARRGFDDVHSDPQRADEALRVVIEDPTAPPQARMIARWGAGRHRPRCRSGARRAGPVRRGDRIGPPTRLHRRRAQDHDEPVVGAGVVGRPRRRVEQPGRRCAAGRRRGAGPVADAASVRSRQRRAHRRSRGRCSSGARALAQRCRCRRRDPPADQPRLAAPAGGPHCAGARGPRDGAGAGPARRPAGARRRRGAQPRLPGLPPRETARARLRAICARAASATQRWARRGDRTPTSTWTSAGSCSPPASRTRRWTSPTG